MPDSLDDRLTLLERAQLLHDATLRRHGEMLDAHEVAQAEMRLLLTRQQHMQADLLTLLAQSQDRLAQHEAHMARLDALLQVIRDLLDRPNGH